MLIDSIGVSAQVPSTPTKAVAANHSYTPASGASVASVDETQLKAMVQDVNRVLEQVASSLEFSLDQQSGKTVVKVVDTNTQEVIRQIPSPELLAISHALDRVQGLLLKQKA
jgi:flagellar protein FlaG